MKDGRVVWSGLQIEQLFGPGVPDGLATKVVQDLLQQFVADKFPRC